MKQVEQDALMLGDVTERFKAKATEDKERAAAEAADRAATVMAALKEVVALRDFDGEQLH